MKPRGLTLGLLVLAGIALASPATAFELFAEHWASVEDAQCKSYGAQPGTDRYFQCASYWPVTDAPRPTEISSRGSRTSPAASNPGTAFASADQEDALVLRPSLVIAHGRLIDAGRCEAELSGCARFADQRFLTLSNSWRRLPISVTQASTVARSSFTSFAWAVRTA